jgi:hypothetical protein
VSDLDPAELHRDSSLRHQLLRQVVKAGDHKLKGALLEQFAFTVIRGKSDSTLFEPVLGALSPELETGAVKLTLAAAQKSVAFAAALAREVEATTLEQGGLLKMFAERIAVGTDPQRAASEVLEIHKNQQGPARSD